LEVREIRFIDQWSLYAGWRRKGLIWLESGLSLGSASEISKSNLIDLNPRRPNRVSTG
jgi:hypothetical protein